MSCACIFHLCVLTPSIDRAGEGRIDVSRPAQANYKLPPFHVSGGLSMEEHPLKSYITALPVCQSGCHCLYEKNNPAHLLMRALLVFMIGGRLLEAHAVPGGHDSSLVLWSHCVRSVTLNLLPPPKNPNITIHLETKCAIGLTGK
jgi:hypothetical protein